MKDNDLKAEFDFLADQYYEQHQRNIEITGEGPEYFSRYKVADFAGFLSGKSAPASILDFGSGIGNSIPHFRDYFPGTRLVCSDVSTRSIELSKKRFPGNEEYLTIDHCIPVCSRAFDAVFTACVFHHIPQRDHQLWIDEIMRVLRAGGVFFMYEHNPLNPLTVRAVNNCPFDVNARLIRAGRMKRFLVNRGWRDVRIEYKVFFPASLSGFRIFEKHMTSIALGAQWRLTATK